MTEQANARDLFRAAYEHRYTWDSKFPGYSADVELKQNDEIYTGHISIKPDMTVEVSGIDDEEVQQSVYTQLRDIVTHRKRGSFEKSHGNNSFTLGEADSDGAVEILVKGDSMGSNYKIRGLLISQVSRVMGRMAFVIDTHESLETPEGSLASRYDAIFRNPQTGDILKELEFHDTFEKIGDYYVMTKQVIHAKENGQATTTEFNYSNVKLLEPALV
ncbi:DUF3386 domain-containing protein [Kamptonema sp. UHCC 0994]|uniref:DUF3386 domain-containing protein n=1 Tax=Kamptonema sp. UHCC 0994 TaxID=3031329 RepID=UPI0023B93F9F|nr:DUF3386 domain-containing protein [Kamptonema sp. UHCC 0994]MDF0554417.1 DUF3386 domain-containing protein [Kamptonema sp. UHCC 0994]